MDLYRKSIINEAEQHAQNKLWMKRKLERAVQYLFPCFMPLFVNPLIDVEKRRVVGETTDKGTACLQWYCYGLDKEPYSVGTVQFVWLKGE